MAFLILKRRDDLEVEEYLSSRARDKFEKEKMVNGKGDLLLQIPPKSYKDPERRRRRILIIHTGSGIGLVYLALAPFIFQSIVGISSIGVLFSAIVVGSIIPVGIWWTFITLDQVLGIYENGVMVEDLDGNEHFFGWGLFTTTLREETRSKEKLSVVGGPGRVVLTEDLPGYEEFAPVIIARVGRYRYKVTTTETKEAYRARFLRALKIMVFAIFVIAVVSTYIVFDTLFSESDLSLLHAGTLGGSFIGISALPFVVSYLLDPERVRLTGIDHRRIAVLCVVIGVILYSIFTLALVKVPLDAMFSREIATYNITDPDHSISPPDAYIDQQLEIRGVLSIQRGETMTIENSTIMFDPSPVVRCGIWVEEGGHVSIVNSTLTSTDPNDGYFIEIHGSGLILDSHLERTDRDFEYGYEDGARLIDAGFKVYSDDFYMANTSIADSYQSGLILDRCSPTLVNCTIESTATAGIEILYGDPEIIGCVFMECLRGIDAFRSSTHIDNSSFIDNEIGISASWSALVIENCTFEGNVVTAIRTESSDIRQSDNEFINNGNIVTEESENLFFFLMLPLMMYIVPVTFLGGIASRLITSWRKEKKKGWSTQVGIV